MAIMTATMPAMNNLHHTPPTSAVNISSRSPGLRSITLPDKRVTGSSIEDAYVDFVLYCNPAVPADTDTHALREAFRIPPRSDGKAFSTFTLYELIAQLHSKELKTWAELALKLGVSPPDQDKGQSSQKIQQYAVRLKRWMHSMHVDAFFDYLMGNTHPYFTQIPTDANPVCEDGRDGVAAEDDMALRALLPQIKPRRGRRKPEDDLNKSPSQRPRLDSPALNSDGNRAPPDTSEPWTAHPDGQRAFLFPPVDQARSSILPGPDSGFPWPSELSQTPLSAYPQSAMTPIHGRAFWGDPSEPRSAITPSKGRRHGAKVVSSAWRSGGSGGSGKTRGRPPINRITDSPLSAVPEKNKSLHTGGIERSSPLSAHPAGPTVPAFPAGPTSAPAPVANQTPSSVPTPTSAGPSRAARPGRLSLQVPERAGGNVRLATPPLPVVVLNGEATTKGDESGHVSSGSVHSATMPSATIRSAAPSTASTSGPMGPGPGPGPSGSAQEKSDDENMTNVHEVESLFVSELLVGHWYDADGNAIPPCSFDEAEAIAQTIIGNMQKQALTPEAFLINLAALAGGSILQRGVRVAITRAEEGPSYSKYNCKWALRYGTFRGNFSLTETVNHDMWKKGRSRSETSDSEEREGALHWKRKYEELLRAVRTSHQQNTDLKVAVVESLKNPLPRGGRTT